MSEREIGALAAHALKTPLGVIMGYAELLLTRGEPALREQGLGQIEAAAQRLLQVTDDVLALISLESPPVREAVALGELLDEAAQRFEERAGRPLVVTVDDALPVVFVDPEHVVALIAALGGSFADGGGAATLAACADGRTAVVTLACGTVAPVTDTAQFARQVARRLAEANGGALAIDGATATVRFPLAG